MVQATLPAAADSLPAGRVLRYWAPHLAALFLPLVALTLLATAPHPGWVAILFVVVPGLAMQLADRFGGSERRQPDPALPAWPYDALLAVLVAIQLLNVALLVRLFAAQSFWSLDALAAVLTVGASSGYSGIVVAHEVGHYLGLKHTNSATNLMGVDVDNDGVGELTMDSRVITDSQRTTMRVSCWVRDPC